MFPDATAKQEKGHDMFGSELFPTLCRVLEKWAYLGPSLSAPSPLPGENILEILVDLGGDHPGSLALRAEEPFARMLSECIRGEVSSPETGRDTLIEMANIFCSHLLTDWWGNAQSAGRPFLPRWCHLENWPREVPQAVCSVECEGHRLDIFYWGAIPTGYDGGNPQ
jgi:hypothetical protein